jgi:protein arginine N-methyltransferase 1
MSLRMILHYRQMADDPLRLGAYERAITAAVRPGDVVTEIGAGLGTYAIFACRAGASRVYAVEDTAIVEVAREVVRANGCGDRVTMLSGRSTTLEVPERARVVVFEDYRTTLIDPGTTRMLADVAARWLEPGGVLVPARARLRVAAVEDPDGWHQLDRFRETGDRVLGVDFSVTRKRCLATLLGRKLEQRHLLTPPTGHEIDLLQLPTAVQLRAETTAERDGVVHGLLLWFEVALGDGWLSTGPLAPASAWTQTLFPIDPPLPVERGAALSWSLDAAPFGDGLVWRWTVQGVEARQGSSLDGMPLRPAVLRLGRGDQPVAITAELALDRMILDAVDGTRPAAQIAAWLRAQRPDRFPTPEDAERRVIEVLSRYVG